MEVRFCLDHRTDLVAERTRIQHRLRGICLSSAASLSSHCGAARYDRSTTLVRGVRAEVRLWTSLHI